MNELDRIRLEHMVSAAEEAVGFSQGETRASLDNDRKLSLALSMLVTIIGEAASRVPKEFQVQSSEIEWSDIVGTRNFLIHACFKIDLDILWDIITNNLPLLIVQLNLLLSQDNSSDGNP